ncbi:MAG TPA: cation diffusion facilitator family transporter [Tepidisphaeraceae bacterium]|jgi:cation diffusion facilitator family transporter|nr:cation diffusion facilitator family transporter [Tepidisphaeraceae bacterium]
MIAWLERVPRSEAGAALLSLGVGIALLTIKFIAYFLTGSAAIFSDALESIVNVAASSVALYALVVAHSPADEEHPYGHGKIEFLSAHFEGGMILLAAIAIAIKAIETLFQPQPVQQLGVGIVLIAAAMAINGGVGLTLIRVGRRQGSITLEADGHHLLSDAVTSATALGALAVVKLLKWPMADPIAALLIAAYIGWMGISLLRRSSAGLMDRQDADDERLLRRILDSHIGPGGKEPRICSYHKLRHRHSGRYHWVDFHIMVPGNLDIDRGHAIASAIEYEIEQALGEGNATAHIEPCLEVPCELESSVGDERK